MTGAERFKIRFAVYLIPRDGDRVLLSLRQNTGWKDGYWSLVAGHVEALESADEALIRESTEEAGITPVNYKHVFTMHRTSDDPESEYVDLFFECDIWDGAITNAEPDKCAGLEWFDIHNLPEQTLGYIRFVLEQYPKGVTYVAKEKE